MSSAWKPLNLRHKTDSIPPLLLKYEFGPSDYKVWLTDLSYIWTESLDRRQILLKALSVDTSIDPSEDSAQMSLFLRTIEDALRQRPGTSVNIVESNDIKQLALHTSTPLPHPLRPLEWSIVLMLARQSTFASAFVSPLLSQQLTAKAEKASLLQQLKEKDSVISKLIEKMQGDGVDLGKVFPGAVSSKSGTESNQRRAVAKSIKGLGEFDQDQWESQVVKDNDGFSRDLRDFLPRIFDDDGKITGEGLQIPDYGDWWKRIGRKDSQKKGPAPDIRKTDANQEGAVEDEFQRQSTPPKPATQTHTPRCEGLITDSVPNISNSPEQKDPDEGGSTTDESNEDLRSSHPKPLPSRTDDAVVSVFANGSKGIHPEPMDLDDDSLTASASEIDNSPAETHSVPKSKSKPKLGKIGGKRKDSSPEIPVVPTSKPKLGKIGGKGKLGKVGGTGSVYDQNKGIPANRPEDRVSPKCEARDETAASKSSEPERKGRTVEQPLEPSPPRETSQERANRKREQLKRELERKSQAASKKKRRF